jgi:hypothetical protein
MKLAKSSTGIACNFGAAKAHRMTLQFGHSSGSYHLPHIRQNESGMQR